MSTEAPQPYRIELTTAAAAGLRGLPKDVRARVAPRIAALAHEPRPRGVKKLQGLPGGYRIRVGDYRILYSIDDHGHVVTVGRIDHRRDVYRG